MCPQKVAVYLSIYIIGHHHVKSSFGANNLPSRWSGSGHGSRAGYIYKGSWKIRIGDNVETRHKSCKLSVKGKGAAGLRLNEIYRVVVLLLRDKEQKITPVLSIPNILTVFVLLWWYWCPWCLTSTWFSFKSLFPKLSYTAQSFYIQGHYLIMNRKILILWSVFICLCTIHSAMNIDSIKINISVIMMTNVLYWKCRTL